jgi:DNA-binding protein H-NS
MPTYQEYQDQISKLQALAELARQDELVEARKKVQDIMQKYNLTPADLTEPSKKSIPVVEKRTVQAKYRDPDTGATWTGRGRAPKWLNGREKNEFLIK